MATSTQITASGLISKVPTAVRPTVQAARRMVRSVAPEATEIIYMSEPPRSKSYMWKLLRYALDGKDVVGIGAFTKHSSLFFYRGRELGDDSGLLEGSGKDSRFITLRSPAEAERPAVKLMVQNAFRLEAGTRRRRSAQ